MIWFVGNGQSIRVWKDPWINDGGNPFVQFERGEVHEDLIVRDLMNYDYCGWD